MKKRKLIDASFFALVFCGLVNLAFNIASVEKQEDKPVTPKMYNKIVNGKNKVAPNGKREWINEGMVDISTLTPDIDYHL